MCGKCVGLWHVCRSPGAGKGVQLGAAAAGGVKVTKSPPLLYPPSTSNFPLPFAHLLPTFCPPSAHLRCRTFDPEEADYFFVPTMAGCIFDMYG